MLTNQQIFWTDSSLKRTIRGFASLLIITCALFYFADTNRPTTIRKGDFPAFYSGAVIAKQGNYKDLYEKRVYTKIQKEHWPDLGNTYYPFLYPAFVAVLLKPLAHFDAENSQLCFWGFMFTCYACSIYLMTKRIPVFKGRGVDVFFALLLFAPLTFGIVGSQNTALSLLYLSASAYFLSSRKKNSDYYAGIALGLWLFKPHFPLLILLFLLITKRFRAVFSATIVGITYFLIGAYTYGPKWPLDWLSHIKEFSPLQIAQNSHLFVSINGVIGAIVQELGSNGLGNLASISSIVIALGLVLYCFGVAIKHLKNSKEQGTEDKAIIEALFILTPLIILISPHTLFYDLSLCLFSLAYFQDFSSDKKITISCAGILLVFYFTAKRTLFLFSPLIAVALYTLLIATRSIKEYKDY